MKKLPRKRTMAAIILIGGSVALGLTALRFIHHRLAYATTDAVFIRTDSLVNLGQAPVPSLGLSGVVMGMMALFVYFVPRARISFFYWFIIKVGTLAIPGWLVALWVLGGDMYDNLVRTASHTNFVAHLGGALMGLLIGMLVFRQKRHWAQELVLEGK